VGCFGLQRNPQALRSGDSMTFRMAATILIAIGLSKIARADGITIFAKAAFGQDECSNSQTSSTAGTTVSASCSPARPGSATATASSSGLFSGVVTVNTINGSGTGGIASITSSTSEYLLLNGGTGSGVLTLDFFESGYGAEGGNATSSEMGFFTNFGGLPSPTYICDSNDCNWDLSNAEMIAIPFTFGTPVLFTELFGLSTSALDGDGAVAMGQILQTGFSVVDHNGITVAGAQLTIVSTPEPATSITFGLAIVILVAKCLRRRAPKPEIPIRL
jgi:hypothetical protein